MENISIQSLISGKNCAIDENNSPFFGNNLELFHSEFTKQIWVNLYFVVRESLRNYNTFANDCHKIYNHILKFEYIYKRCTEFCKEILSHLEVPCKILLCTRGIEKALLSSCHKNHIAVFLKIHVDELLNWIFHSSSDRQLLQLRIVFLYFDF